LGSRITVKGRRAGVAQHLVSEVTAFEPGRSFVEEQRQGPFRRWAHTYRFEAQADGGTLLTEEIDYEPPGGVLGLLLTAEKIERDLAAVYAFRRETWAELPAE
jgi:ligand-binding SRPBCC domain-containing protein